MELQYLQDKYKKVPIELKNLRRWIGFKVEGREDGKTTKRPYNAISGNLARVNDSLTWTTFNSALNGCVKYGFDGLGFILGDGIFGIDLDNHPDKDGVCPLDDEAFKTFSEEFITTLDSYSELSQSGKGIHIICYGKLPEGNRRKGCVEMYDSGRFFAFTGNVIHNTPINEREEQVKPLWEKYVNTPKPANEAKRERVISPMALELSDEDVINAALKSKTADKFYRYYHDGDISMDNNDQSAADLAFCNMLAFWCNGNQMQMDRIFRNSALMRNKWDEYRGEKTYGEITLNKALADVKDGYVRFSSRKYETLLTIRNKGVRVDENGEVLGETNGGDEFCPEMNIDENGNPIFRIKRIFKAFPLNDTGNAQKFYAYFGDLFKYNVTDKIFMFWTGKTWIKDTTNIIRKYANKLIEILKEEEKDKRDEIDQLIKDAQTIKAKDAEKILDAMIKNSTRVANKAGKDAMLSEFSTLYDIPVESSVFNQDDFLLNTDSGIVDLRTGEISPFDKTKLISKNTGVKISYEKPEIWLKFLRSVFNTDDLVETESIVDSMQTCLGYSLSGSTAEQVMFLLYGDGSNGKSTLTEQIAHILGDYGDNIASSILMQQKNLNSSSIFSIAKLQGARFVETGETDNGNRFAEAQVKILTGSDTISAQFKFGNEFSFKPKFKIWMSTNNKPYIFGTDKGIWRRIFLFPFLNTFDGAQKDKTLPQKLKEESDKILGWCVQGFLKYQENGGLLKTDYQDKAISEYKEEMDTVARFIDEECTLSPKAQVDCKMLFSRYKEWYNNAYGKNPTAPLFKNNLKRKGIIISKTPDNVSIYVGIRLNGVNISGKKWEENK